MILVTGFGPYREDVNASGELVSSLKSDLPEGLRALRDQLVFEVISCDDTSRDTEHRTLEEQLGTLLRIHEPNLCLFTGQAPSYNKITIEKIATNSFMREVIAPDRPVAYWTNLPGTDSLRAALEERNIPAGYSFYAGQHLCNHIMYSSLYFAERDSLAHRTGFVHIPVLPEQARRKYRDSPFMPIEMARKALSITINHAFEASRRDSQTL